MLARQHLRSCGPGSRVARVPSVPHPSRRPSGRPICPPCRITNTRDEVWKAMGLPDPEDEQDYVEVDTTPVWDPENGPLDERRDIPDWADEMQSDQINIEHAAYWFTEPPGGWQLEARYPATTECEATFPQPHHDGTDPLDDVNSRMPYTDLEEGDELLGVVTDVWLHHGAQVDFAGEFDGLIPITEDQWADVGDDILPGTVVSVKVHKLRERFLYRWPVQLELLDDKVAPLIMAPQDYECPADLAWAYDQGWSIEEIYAKLGREIPTYKLYLQPDDANSAEMQHADFAWDNDDDVPPRDEDVVESEMDFGTRTQVQSIINSIM